MSFTNAQLAQKISDLIDYWSTFSAEYSNWLGGTVSGGPGNDGDYPLTDYTGDESLVACPAKLEDDVSGYVGDASASATAAAASEAAAATSESNASTSASTATAQAVLADADRVAAELAETNAQDSAVTATAQANLATDRVTYAAEWANKAFESLVSAAAGGDEVDDYSALHWATVAEGFAGSVDSGLYGQLAQDEEVTGSWTLTGQVNFGAATVLLNNQRHWGKDTGAANRNLIGVNTSNVVEIGDLNLAGAKFLDPTIFGASGFNMIQDSSDGWLRLNQGLSFTSGVYTPGAMRIDGLLDSAQIRATEQIGSSGAGTSPTTGHWVRMFVSGTDSYLDSYDFTGAAFKNLQIRSLQTTFNATVLWPGGSSSNANTAYGWGDHASAGYEPGDANIMKDNEAATISTTHYYSVGPRLDNGVYLRSINNAATVNVNLIGLNSTDDIRIGHSGYPVDIVSPLTADAGITVPDAQSVTGILKVNEARQAAGFSLDTVITDGVYHLNNATGAGHPTGETLAFGSMINTDNSDVHGQLYISRTDNGRLYVRSAAIADFTGIEWSQLWSDKDFDYTLLAPLASPTFTGTLAATTIDASESILARDLKLDAADGNGLRFWSGSTAYSIHMSTGASATWGGRLRETSSDYNMYFRMASGTNRGFVFQTEGQVETFTINPDAVRSAVDIKVADNIRMTWGNSDDASMYFNAVDLLTTCAAGVDWRLHLNGGAEAAIVAIVNDGVYTYFDGALKTQTTSGGLTVTGGLTASGDVYSGSAARVQAGSGGLRSVGGAGSGFLELHGDAASYIDFSLDGSGVTDYSARLRYYTDYLRVESADFKVGQDLYVAGDAVGVFNFTSPPTKTALGIPYYVTATYTGGKITVASSAPGSPAKGDIWFDTT